MSLVLVEEIIVTGYGAELFEVLILEGADHDIARTELILRVVGIRKIGLAAQDDAVHRQLGVPVAPALADDTELAVHGQGMSEHPGRDLHLGELDHGAQSGLSPMVDGRQD